MKIVVFCKKHSRYHKLLDDYNILTEKYNQLKSLYEDGEKALESIKGVRNNNPKLEKCTSDACKTCKYCVKKWTPWDESFIVGCNKNIVCECFKEEDDD